MKAPSKEIYGKSMQTT